MAQKYTKINIAVFDSYSSKREKIDKRAIATRFFTIFLYFDSLKDNFVQRFYSSLCKLSNKNKKNISIFQSTQASIR